MTQRYLAIHNGFIAVADKFQSDWTVPFMSRTVWVSKHKWDMNADVWAMSARIDAGLMEGDKQHWAIVLPSGSRVEFSTPSHGEHVLGVEIAKPRKRKGQTRPWRWHQGEWVCTAEF